MDEIQTAIEEAWARVRPKLLKDPAELRRRIRRRTETYLARPPRPWCLAVRANDARLMKYCSSHPFAEPTNPHSLKALREGDFSVPVQDGPPLKHEVLLNSRGLYELCSLVRVRQGGESPAELCKNLGLSQDGGLTPTRFKGGLQTRYVRGHWGMSPILTAREEELDPNAFEFRGPDPAWSFTASELLESLRDNIEETLVRVPAYRGPHACSDETENLHPEHPDRVGSAEYYKYAGKGKYRLGRRPRVDDVQDVMAWYKWKGDEYVGYDWRLNERNPQVKKNYERFIRIRAYMREYHKRERERKWRKDRTDSGSLKFNGWRLVCPKCEKCVKKLYLPLRVPSLLNGLGLDEIETVAGEEGNLWALPHEEKFGCQECHYIFRWNRMIGNAWPTVVGYLSGGLLLGSEVEKPAWFTKDRRRAYQPRLGRAPSARREAARKLLLDGSLSYPQIAKEMKLTRGQVGKAACAIYKQEGVHSREELCRKYGIEPPKRRRRSCAERVEGKCPPSVWSVGSASFVRPESSAHAASPNRIA